MRVFVVLAFLLGSHYLNGQDVFISPRIDSLNHALKETTSAALGL